VSGGFSWAATGLVCSWLGKRVGVVWGMVKPAKRFDVVDRGVLLERRMMMMMEEEEREGKKERESKNTYLLRAETLAVSWASATEP